MPDQTFNLECLLPVLEAGAEIPGFRFCPPKWDDPAHWEWRPLHAYGPSDIDSAPSDARYAAIVWLEGHVSYDGCAEWRISNDIQALCTAWLKENGNDD